MPSDAPEATPRNFNPASVPELSDETRQAVNAAFEAMSNWRRETVNSSEKNGEQVIEKMAAAARALGWPQQIVDAARAQMQSITTVQIQTMDRMMDAWEEQIKSPNASSALVSKLRALPSFGAAGNWSNANAFQTAALNPLRFYMQYVEQWQKAWVDAVGFWVNAGKLRESVGLRRT
jgi:hypothetical protein